MSKCSFCDSSIYRNLSRHFSPNVMLFYCSCNNKRCRVYRLYRLLKLPWALQLCRPLYNSVKFGRFDKLWLWLWERVVSSLSGPTRSQLHFKWDDKDVKDKMLISILKWCGWARDLTRKWKMTRSIRPAEIPKTQTGIFGWRESAPGLM